MQLLLPIFTKIDSPGMILLLLVLFFGLIAGVTLLLRWAIPGLKEKSGKVNEEIAVQQELDRVLEPITDEKVLAEMEKTSQKPKDE